MGSALNLDELLGSLNQAMRNAQELTDRQHLERLRVYYNEDGTPKYEVVQIPDPESPNDPEAYRELRVPLLALAPPSGTQIKELSFDFPASIVESSGEGLDGRSDLYVLLGKTNDSDATPVRVRMVVAGVATDACDFDIKSKPTENTTDPDGEPSTDFGNTYGPTSPGASGPRPTTTDHADSQPAHESPTGGSIGCRPPNEAEKHTTDATVNNDNSNGRDSVDTANFHLHPIGNTATPNVKGSVSAAQPARSSWWWSRWQFVSNSLGNLLRRCDGIVRKYPKTILFLTIVGLGGIYILPNFNRMTAIAPTSETAPECAEVVQSLDHAIVSVEAALASIDAMDTNGAQLSEIAQSPSSTGSSSWWYAPIEYPIKLAIPLLAVSVTIYFGFRQWRLAHFTTKWHELLRFLHENSSYMDAERNLKYKESFESSEEKWKYEATARMCVAFVDDMYFLGYGKQIDDWYCGAIQLLVGRHRQWFEDNLDSYDRNFIDFVRARL